MVGQTISHYRIISELGRGGMGVVYKAHDTKLNRTVALKFLPPHVTMDEEATTRFVHEAQAAAAIEHANICTIYEIGETEPVPREIGGVGEQLFIAMAYYEGKTLKERLQETAGKGLPVDEAVTIAHGIAAGLARAHEQDIVHRDIKPANVMITSRGEVKILDFGLAKLAGTTDLTRSGSTVGTAAYMSPEQIRGETVDQRSDVWSLGIVLYQMLTGKRPFEGDYIQAVSYAILNDEPQLVTADSPRIEPSLSSIVERCLQKEPEGRFQSAGQVAELLAGSTSAAATQRPARRPQSAASLFRTKWAMIAGAALILALTSWLILRPAPAPETVGHTPVVDERTTIAVLPAQTAGGTSESIGEGLDIVLSMGLDAVDDWRAVSSRTVRARWNERVADGTTADLATALDVGKATGARFAVLPTAVKLGSTVRLSADVYDLRSLSPTDESIAVEGHVDSLAQLVDRLSFDILRSILGGEGEISETATSSALSKSPDALTAFLAGEVLFYDFRLIEARDAFRNAIEIDSAFAFAHLRLAELHDWGATVDGELQQRHLESAWRFRHRLNERESLIVEAWLNPDPLASVLILRHVVDRFPDEATAWTRLGEVLLHQSAPLATYAEIREVFSRAVELDPFRPSFYPHPAGFAFIDADSATAAVLTGRFAELTRGLEGGYNWDFDPRVSSLALDLVFGSTDDRASASSRLADPKNPLRRAESLATSAYLRHPRYWSLLKPMLEAVANPELGSEGLSARTGESAERVALVGLAYGSALYAGQLQNALQYLESIPADDRVGMSVWLPFIFWQSGLPVSDDYLEARFGPNTIGDVASRWHLVLAGFLAADQDRWEDHDQVLVILQNRDAEEWYSLVKAYGVWRRGDPESALTTISQLVRSGQINWFGALWMLGELHLENEQLKKAEEVFATFTWSDVLFLSFTFQPQAQLRLGQIYERQGETEKAVDAYSYFVEYWSEADPELQPMLQEARLAIARLKEM